MKRNCLSRSVLSLVVVAILAQRSSSSEDPCLTPNQIGNTKRTTDEDPGTCPGLCDNYIQSGGWYRLDVSNSGARMPESCVPIWHCGTYIPIWLNGVHPTVNSPVATSARACAQISNNGDCCEWSSDISVKRCGTDPYAYFVYQLVRPPFCDMAYCAGSDPTCPDKSSWNDILKNCTSPEFPSLGTTVVLSEPYVSSSAVVNDNNGRPFTATSFSLKCTLNYDKRLTDDGARYGVVFQTSDGSTIYSAVLKSTDAPVVVMSESYLVGHIDQYVTCSATSYWVSAYPKRSPFIVSNSRYIGIKFYRDSSKETEITGPLSVVEGDRVTVYVAPTFPITTPACLASPTAPCYPSYSFRVYTLQLYLSSCSISVSSSSIASFVFSPIADKDGYPTPRVGSFKIIPVNTIQTPGSIYNGYNSKTIPISIVERSWSYCLSWGDPHISTFYGNYYHIYESGQFTFISIPSRKIEVQVTHTPCNGVSCNCGVIAREGNNILGINNCPSVGSTTFIRYLKDINNPGGYIRSDSAIVKTIVLPSGMLIPVTIYAGYVDVQAYVYGLDGTPNNALCSNTLTRQDSPCGSECSRYRVQGTNFFNIQPGTPSLCINDAILVPQCDCTNGGTVGSTCPLPAGVPLYEYSNTCNNTLSRRRKRADTFQQSTSTTIAVPSAITNPDNVALPASDSSISDQEAINACMAALNASTVYDLCINQLRLDVSFQISSCKFDVQTMGDLVRPPSMATMIMESQCKALIDSSNSTTKDNYTQQYDNQYCPQCNNHGQCVSGSCKCASGYQSSDCSIPQGAVPSITSLQDYVCDIRDQSKAGCTIVFILAKNVSDNSFMCKITETSTGKTLQNPTDKNHTINGNSVTCPLPILPVSLDFSRNFSVFNYSVDVSLTNDGVGYSNSMTFTVYDGLNTACNATICIPKPVTRGGSSRNIATSVLLIFVFVLLQIIQ